MKIKRIEAIHALEKKLAELRALIPVYNARQPTYEHVLAKQIINLDIQLIEAKTDQFSLHKPSLHFSAPQLPLPHYTAAQPQTSQPIELNTMAGILTERPQQIQNIYWQPGQPIGAPISNFRKIKYLLLPPAVPDLNQALSGARVVCRRDLHKQLIKFGGAANVWMTDQVEYEPVNPLANKQTFEQYLSAALTRIFRCDVKISGLANTYIDNLRLLTDQIREFNAKFIGDKSGLRLPRILQFTLKIVKYRPLERRGWQALPEFLAKNEATMNIQNYDKHFSGYSFLFLFEHADFPERNKHCICKTISKKHVSPQPSRHSPIPNLTQRC